MSLELLENETCRTQRISSFLSKLRGQVVKRNSLWKLNNSSISNTIFVSKFKNHITHTLGKCG